MHTCILHLNLRILCTLPTDASALHALRALRVLLAQGLRAVAAAVFWRKASAHPATDAAIAGRAAHRPGLPLLPLQVLWGKNAFHLKDQRPVFTARVRPWG
jgi:hypothetical protein